MIKLYKRIDGVLHYWEAWNDGDIAATTHWGRVGDQGTRKLLSATNPDELSAQIRAVTAERRADDYSEFSIDDYSILMIEYAVDGMGTVADLDKRHALQERMDQTLGWTGVGHCDGGSIGSGSMEVCCFVVDYATAEEVVALDLRGTKFGDYTRIYEEDRED